MSRRRKRLIVGSALSILSVAVFVLLDGRAQRVEMDRPGAPPLIKWHPCVELNVEADIRCGRFTVFAADGSFQLPFVVFKDRSAQLRDDPLVYLPGGPGESLNTGRLSLEDWYYWLAEAKIHRDFVIFDPRGLSLGSPSWDCDSYTQISKQLLAHQHSLLSEYQAVHPILEQCFDDFALYLNDQLEQSPGFAALRLEAPLAEPLQLFTTRNNAADARQLMLALGYRQWNLYGISYGTRVAVVSALTQQQALRGGQQDGEGWEEGEVRSMILDSPYPLQSGDLASVPLLWRQAFARFWSACDEGAVCEPSVDGSEELFWRAMSTLKQRPLSIEVTLWRDDSVLPLVVNDHRLAAAVYSALYSRSAYADIISVLRAVEGGDEHPVVEFMEHFLNNVFSENSNSMVYLATECNDNELVEEETFRQALDQADGWQAYFEHDWRYDICRGGQFLHGDLPAMKDIHTPTLVFAGGLDPVTPADEAFSLLMPWLKQAALIIIEKGGHAELAGGACGHSLFAEFLDAPHRFLENYNTEQNVICR